MKIKSLLLIPLILLSLLNFSFAEDTSRFTLDASRDLDQVALLAVITPSYTVAAGGDSCTGNLLYSHHAENNDDATTSANGTQGCSASETYKSWVKTSAVYDNTAGYFGDGAYSIKFNGYGHKAVITTTGWMDLTAIGSISMWFRSNGANDTYLFQIYIDTTHYVNATYAQGTQKIQTLVRDGTNIASITSTATVPSGGGWLQFGWDAATDLVQVRICDDAACSGESWETSTGTAFVDIGTMPASLRIVSNDDGSGYGWIDNVKIYSSSNCTP